MAKKLKVSLLFIVVVLLGLAIYAGWILRSQGNASDYWSKVDNENVKFDEYGIPTIKAANWNELIRRQGHVIASERLWQMDLIRRKAGGRLAEWFGPKAFQHDQEMQLQNRQEIASVAADNLPPDERKTCDEYARGVNDFITSNNGKWGVEYKLIGFEPEPWSCKDSVLALIEMADMLTASAESEAKSETWRRNLSTKWQAFLFSQNHPWNKPLFGESDVAHAPLPPAEEYLTPAPIVGEKHASINVVEHSIVGSNNWAWAGPTGKFVANDPHLGQSVPQIWYAMRLITTKNEWLAGVSVPGIPGVIIGMNPYVAWAFTNTGEDVDDFLEEKLNEAGTEYLASIKDGVEVWLPITKKSFQILVKDEKEPRTVEGNFTHRGPLLSIPNLGKQFYSRQWLALRPEVMRLPVEMFFRAQDLNGLSAALAGMKIPAQNAVAMDRKGNIRYQTTGTGIDRKMSGLRPVDAIAGEWIQLQPSSMRPVKDLEFTGTPIMMATANERIWVDSLGHTWFNDDRKDRIMTQLASKDQTRQSMEELHLDTTGRFRKLIIDWIVTRADKDSEAKSKIPDRWRTWKGSSMEDQVTFDDADLAEKEMTKIFLARVAETIKSKEDRKTDYSFPMRRAWFLTVLLQEGNEGTQIFGVNDEELAKHLVNMLVGKKKEESYSFKNRWLAQHPFVTGIPVLGKIFAVSETEQWGAGDLVLAEKTTFGPSVRMVWDMDKPMESTWVFPVGQSGHVWSKHYKNFHDLWAKKVVTNVFPKDEQALFGY
jgi:penicillin amidase